MAIRDTYDGITIGNTLTQAWLENKGTIKSESINKIYKIKDRTDLKAIQADFNAGSEDTSDVFQIISLADTTSPLQLDAYPTIFGDNIQASRIANITGKFDFGIDTEGVSLKGQAGTGNFALKGETGFENKLSLFSGETANSFINIENPKYLRYVAGYEFGLLFTAYFKDLPTVDGKIEIGLMDENDGLGLAYKDVGNGMEFGMIVRSAGVENFIPQTEFNIDKADGTGNSGFNLNIQEGNIYQLRGGYLGFAAPILCVYDERNKIIPLHVVEHPNNNDGKTIISRTSLPVFGYISNGTADENVEVQIGSYNAYIIDGDNVRLQDRTFFKSVPEASYTGTNDLIIAFKNKTDAQLFAMPTAKDNRVAAELLSFTCNTDANAQGGVLSIYIIPSTDILTGTFTDHNSNRSVLETSTDATFTLDNGILEYEFSIPKTAYQLQSEGSLERKLRPGETALILWSGSTTDLSFNNTWKEQH